MQRLIILPILAIAAAAGGVLVARHVVAWQAEAAAPQEDATGDDAAGTAETDAEATEPAVEPEPDPEVVAAANKLLETARDKLYDYRSVRAKMTEKASFGTRRFTAEGEYISGLFPQMWLEYRVEVGGSEGRLLEVCDGQILFTEKEIRAAGSTASASPGSQDKQIQVTRKDVRQIRQATGTGIDVPPEVIVQAELSLGGLPTLLASLQRTMLFDTITEGTYEDRPYTILQGGWKEEYLTQLSQQMGQAAQALAPFMPDRVRVYLDGDTLFPTRILYLKQASVDPVKYQAIMTLEFTDVVLNEEIDPQRFRYVPPAGTNVIDETGVYLNMIQGMRAAADAQAQDPSQPQDVTDPEAEPGTLPQPPGDAP
jgi:hypothetical protein